DGLAMTSRRAPLCALLCAARLASCVKIGAAATSYRASSAAFSRCSVLAAGKAPPKKVEITNFIRNIMKADLQSGKSTSIVTRFPPEPNGYLHIGHAKSICVNFGLGGEMGGVTYMRFDDTNPEKEKREYIDAIQEDVRWLGFDWGAEDRLTFASDYFDKASVSFSSLPSHLLYFPSQVASSLLLPKTHAPLLGLIFSTLYSARSYAYVDSLTPAEMREYRGTLTKPGTDSPHRTRSVEENLALFAKMAAGEMADGERRPLKREREEPILHREAEAPTHEGGSGVANTLRGTSRKGDREEPAPHNGSREESRTDWLDVGEAALRLKIDMSSGNINMRDPVIYRLKVDATHPQTGDKWKIYPMYDYAHCLTDALEVVSKRKLIQLVNENHVDGWCARDDPRMPTICGLRRRGVPPDAIRLFVERTVAVLDPLRVVLTDWPEEEVDTLTAQVHPKLPELGNREIPLGRQASMLNILIDRDDFSENPPPKYKRLTPGGEVRLRYGYVIKCEEVVKDDEGNVIELRCSHEPCTRQGGKTGDGRKVKGIIHWVSEEHSSRAQVMLYDRLFREPVPGASHEDGDFLRDVNPDSLQAKPAPRVQIGSSR
ncbi:MAG: hypothetical protein SGPRY_006806, partial [Prymnesium sp.]